MNFIRKCNVSLFLLLVIFTNCSESPQHSQSISIPVDTLSVINQILQNDSLKRIDTSKFVYEINGESYIKGEIIKRVKSDAPIPNKNITLDANSMGIRSLLSNIQSQSELAIITRPGAFEGAKKLSFHVVNKPLTVFLSEYICKGQPFNYRIEETALIFFKRVIDTIRLKGPDSVNHFIMVPNETQIHLKLPDRTNVWLNAGTIISFNGDLTKNRSIRMAGEGYFDVIEGNAPLTIKTQGNHKFILRHGALNINSFDEKSHDPDPNNLPATDQELNKLASNGELYDINCNPCSLDSLIDNWNHKQNHSVVSDKSRVHDFAEPVYVNMTQASFSDIITNVIEKQSKLGGYFTKPMGEFIITKKDTIEPINFFANLKSGEMKVYCGTCKQEMNLIGNECLTFGKYDSLTKKSCDPTISMSWTKGYFEPSQHKSFLENLERWYDIEVTLSKSSLIHAVGGHIPFQASLKELLELFKLNQIKYKLMLTNNGEKLNLILE